MSPTAFKQQTIQLLSEITKCYEFCEAIRANRRLGSTHQALDSLQSGLKGSAYNIQTLYGTLNNGLGSRMELGDETARSALNRAIRDVQSNIQPRLSDIAYRRRDSRDPEVPGFGELLKKLERIEDDVVELLESLARRFQNSRPTAPKQPSKPKPKTGEEVIVSLKELDILIQHMKNSWIEKSVAGKILYVNAFDEKKHQWERPDGFMKTMLPIPKPTTRTSTWEEQPSRRPREEHWSNPRGW